MTQRIPAFRTAEKTREGACVHFHLKILVLGEMRANHLLLQLLHRRFLRIVVQNNAAANGKLQTWSARVRKARVNKVGIAKETETGAVSAVRCSFSISFVYSVRCDRALLGSPFFPGI